MEFSPGNNLHQLIKKCQWKINYVTLIRGASLSLWVACSASAVVGLLSVFYREINVVMVALVWLGTLLLSSGFMARGAWVCKARTARIMDLEAKTVGLFATAWELLSAKGKNSFIEEKVQNLVIERADKEAELLDFRLVSLITHNALVQRNYYVSIPLLFTVLILVSMYLLSQSRYVVNSPVFGSTILSSNKSLNSGFAQLETTAFKAEVGILSEQEGFKQELRAWGEEENQAPNKNLPLSTQAFPETDLASLPEAYLEAEQLSGFHNSESRQSKSPHGNDAEGTGVDSQGFSSDNSGRVFNGPQNSDGPVPGTRTFEEELKHKKVTFSEIERKGSRGGLNVQADSSESVEELPPSNMGASQNIPQVVSYGGIQRLEYRDLSLEQRHLITYFNDQGEQ